MYYFRPLPDINEIFRSLKYLFIKPVSDVANSVFKIDNSHHKSLLFPRSRDAMNFVLKVISGNKNKKVNVYIPDLFCWEIIRDFDCRYVNFFFYSINETLNPDWKILDKHNLKENPIDVFILVSFFGIKPEVEIARAFCEKNNIFLFFDNTHCVLPDTVPNVNEFLFLSSYKQFAIPHGSILLLNNIENKTSVNENVSNLIIEYHKLPLISPGYLNIIWLLKSCFVYLTQRMKYVPNNYVDTTSVYAVQPNINSNLIHKGVTALSFYELQLAMKDPAVIVNLTNTYHFYDQIKSVIIRFFRCVVLNSEYPNSHLYALQFLNEQDANSVYGVLMKVKLPVVTWPEKKYINLINDSNRQEKLKSIIDKLVFLSAFSSGYLENEKKNKILSKIEYELRRIKY